MFQNNIYELLCNFARSRIHFLLSPRNTGSHRIIQDTRCSPSIRPRHREYSPSHPFLKLNKESRLRDSTRRARAALATPTLRASAHLGTQCLIRLREFRRNFLKRKINGSHRLGNFRQKYTYFKYSYVGITQIRLPVEGHTFLSACNTSSRQFVCRIYRERSSLNNFAARRTSKLVLLTCAHYIIHNFPDKCKIKILPSHFHKPLIYLIFPLFLCCAFHSMHF